MGHMSWPRSINIRDTQHHHGARRTTGVTASNTPTQDLETMPEMKPFMIPQALIGAIRFESPQLVGDDLETWAIPNQKPTATLFANERKDLSSEDT